MVVDLVLETGVAFRIRAGLTLQNDGAAIGEDEAGPDEQHARLSEGDLAVVDADELGALRNKQIASGWAVVDVLGDLARDLTGQVGADAREERGRYDRTCLHDVFRGGGVPPHPAYPAFL